MTRVPLPSILGYERSEVRRPNVGYGRGEAEQSPGDLLPVRVGLTLDVRPGRHTVLLHGALQQVQRLVLQVGGGHQLVEVGLQVRLDVSADHGGEVMLTFPGTEDVSKHVVMTVQQTLLVTKTTDPADNFGHVAATKYVCLHGGSCVSETQMSTGHYGLSDPPTIPTRDTPLSSIKPHLDSALHPCSASSQPDLHRVSLMKYGDLWFRCSCGCRCC